MATVVEQLYSQTHWGAPFDGVQVNWNFTFSGGYILPEHVKAYYLDAAGERVDIAVVEDDLVGEFQIAIDPPVPTTATRLVIYRDTPKDEPLVDFEDGANIGEANLDRIARQAVFVAAEVLDGASISGVTLDSVLERVAALEAAAGADLSELGFKSLKLNTYTGSSNVLTADNGKAHFKTDGTSVTVPNTLPVEFLTTIVNHGATNMTVSFSAAVGVMQGGDATGQVSWSLRPRQALQVVKVADGYFYISGYAV